MTLCFECDSLVQWKPRIRQYRDRFVHFRFVWLWFGITFDSRRLDEMLNDARNGLTEWRE